MNRITNYEKLATDITNWIRDYAITNNIKSLVVGVSGGIDSAVVSTLCAMTGLPTYCAIIEIHSDKEHIARAISHCQYLDDDFSNVSWRHTNMDKTMETITIPVPDWLPTNITLERLAANTKSRLRTIALYNYAGAGHGIVVGTGNKVEDFGIGYCTKGGDLCTDISPIGDLYKTEVRELGKYLGVSDDIIQAQPSDGLYSDSRSDESVIGATYEELEWAMSRTENIYKDIHTPRQKEVMAIYTKLNTQNQHKMQPIPIFKLNQ